MADKKGPAQPNRRDFFKGSAAASASAAAKAAGINTAPDSLTEEQWEVKQKAQKAIREALDTANGAENGINKYIYRDTYFYNLFQMMKSRRHTREGLGQDDGKHIHHIEKRKELSLEAYGEARKLIIEYEKDYGQLREKDIYMDRYEHFSEVDPEILNRPIDAAKQTFGHEQYQIDKTLVKSYDQIIDTFEQQVENVMQQYPEVNKKAAQDIVSNAMSELSPQMWSDHIDNLNIEEANQTIKKLSNIVDQLYAKTQQTLETPWGKKQIIRALNAKRRHAEDEGKTPEPEPTIFFKLSSNKFRAEQYLNRINDIVSSHNTPPLELIKQPNDQPSPPPVSPYNPGSDKHVYGINDYGVNLTERQLGTIDHTIKKLKSFDLKISDAFDNNPSQSRLKQMTAERISISDLFDCSQISEKETKGPAR